jgi:predicted PurR-regulated permease PerM
VLKLSHGRKMEKPDTPDTERKVASTPDANGANGGGSSDPLVIRMPVDVRGVSLSIIAALAGIIALQYAQTVLIPVVLGVLLSYGLSPMVTSLARHHVPRALGAALAVFLLVGSIGVGVYTLSDEAGAIIAKVPEAAQRIRQRVAAQRSQRGSAILQQVQDAAKEIEKTADAATKPVEDTRASRTGRDQLQQVEVVEPAFRASDYIWIGGVGLFGFLGQFAVILFLVYFLLVTGDLYKRKLVKIAGPTLAKKRVTVQILDEINQQIESFIKVQFITSLIVAVATGLTLWAFGLENYAMWGLLAGLFNSIPYLGPLLVTGGLGIVAFMQFNDVARSLYVSGAAFVITSLEGFLLTPMLMGRAAQMNPVAIFVGLLFWSWIWGVWGTVLAVPMLMMLKAICDHVEDLQPIGELLGE